MQKLLFLCVLSSFTTEVLALECQANSGLMHGTVIDSPYFINGHLTDGVDLSHTKFHVINDADQLTYEVAVDNVFIDNYNPNSLSIPDALTANISKGQKVFLCGDRYVNGILGIHWVHTNCGNNNHPNGFLVVESNQEDIDLTDNRTYCYIWQ